MSHSSKAEFQSSGDQVRIVRSSERQRELDKLPDPSTRRWVMRRKAQVVTAVRNGVLSLPEACDRYKLSEEEFKTWSHLLDHHGMGGLRATRVQEYRARDQEAAE
ncbi:MAG: DUF1153 domain-containing protein [Bdellovibrionales bacterium]